MKSLLTAERVHFIGIGGISMSAIAHIFIEKGIKVTGSDAKASPATLKLEEAGATIYIGHSSDNITDQDAVVYTGAISDDNPEFAKAQSLEIPTYRRTQAIDAIMESFEVSLAVTGTHGKTTITSMLAMILEETPQDASYLVGAKLPHTHKAYKLSPSTHIAVEACEYKASFLDLHPTTIIVNNIEEEHLDYYDDLDHIIRTYQEFATHLKPKNYLILNHDDFNTRRLIKDCNCNFVTYGINESSTFEARQITFDMHGYPSFEVFYEDEKLMELTLKVCGKFNVYNALGAISAAYVNGISIESIQSALSKFSNAERRFEILGTYKGATLISDYAHHPSEVKVTVQAAKNFDNKEICVVFQPHTYSRVKSLLLEMSSAFKDVNHLYITDIYAAREANTYNIHSQDLVDLIIEEGQNATYIKELKDVIPHLDTIAKDNMLIIMMGAGDIDQFARTIVD
ncbi:MULTISPECIES: UDP-N-acetylmuramate--L-alanine ligase [unclassified Fusibacter]|uniref:UDP-N-acetylmuramate--L-alanine ligase n=1 Tax=unclassified Fusibacter TaxID=2624464 RepID=UPI0010120825|nr:MULTISPECIES: UDP-N-acetylmuramate--L-alanine ligase [unclassified Fusibacter]MCK8059474.1 UDP-N-acetylmuramate--L-alanine ligase [Fusibacter sp. A2]NPE21062.1 UDP-N-acetylmuramate--L-alanine ligase [Fusibacter sp. A1]RXV62336.1 UDP-N-acetylmuramate--L-alanine ligase [Fusibacter sp. A1]